MSTGTYTPRGYQERILERVSGLRDMNILLELDCGMGKRFITHQIIVEGFSDMRVIIIVNSTSSLQETFEYLHGEYGGLDEDELGMISSRVPTWLRREILKERRIVVATPQVLTNVLEKYPELAEDFQLVIINEVDTLVRRIGDKRVLTQPWPKLMRHIGDKWLIGMSGTLRDSHAIVTHRGVRYERDLKTLGEFFGVHEVIYMEELEDTDLEEHVSKTVIEIRTLEDRTMVSIDQVVDELIHHTRSEIRADSEDEYEYLPSQQMHLMLEHLPIEDDIRARYGYLLLLRKRVFAMPYYEVLRILHNPFMRRYLNPQGLKRKLKGLNPKIREVRSIARSEDKIVVLCSFLKTVNSIARTLENSGVNAFVLTGKVFDKQTVLKNFKDFEGRSALIMSPVGERDLDIPQAEVLVVCDVTNTSKTMYQRIKRTRGGRVIFLCYEGTSEERKVVRLVEGILERYPWSITMEGII